MNKLTNLFSVIEHARFNNYEERINFLREYMIPFIGKEPIEMMISKGFCLAPASTRFHGNFEGGLFEHSLGVTYCLMKYTECLHLNWDSPGSPVRVGMLHDLCKIDDYEKEYAHGGFTYVHNSKPIIKGHGAKSVIYALYNGCELTEEEIACITYHMGAYETNQWDAYDNAIKKYPNVLYTHTADMEASKILGV